MLAKTFTPEEVSLIIDKLKSAFPSFDIKVCNDDRRYIRFTKVLNEQRVDTIPIPVVYTENVHIFECYHMAFDPAYEFPVGIWNF